MRVLKKASPLEGEEQVTFMRIASLRRFRDGKVRDYLYSVPNTIPFTGKKAMLSMVRMKAEGLTPGVPDIECFVAMPPYTGWHGEMKRQDGVPSDVKEHQTEMMARMTAAGRKCDVGYGAVEMWKKLCEYLKIPVMG